ncbi:unnamed protein product [Porites evermanni]|uniref:Transmembrane protein 241 n=1 Tax=Porites evermanni TaxID=104178 RepID=A0ABN8LLX6_9CNID|nr:unnamed protein product [Porites evermanni]
MATWRTRFALALFCCLAVATTFVNKHVLSNLKFTYPTVFQSWQTGTAAVVLLSMSALGYIDLNIVPVNRSVLLSWLPAAMLFSGIIYSGSVALSRLPVPVFYAIHNITTIIQTLLESVLLKKDPSLSSQFCLIFLAFSVVLVAASDPEFDQMGYKWMMVHCVLSALYVTYGRSRNKNSISDLEKMFYNAVISVFILLGIGVSTGEVYRLLEFPFLYSSQFHVGCMASGIFGAALGFCHVFLQKTEFSFSMGIIHSLNKILISLLSLFIFNISLSINMAISLIMALCFGVLYSFSVIVQKESDQRAVLPVHDS